MLPQNCWKCGLLLRINMNQNLMSRVLLHSNWSLWSTRLCKFPWNFTWQFCALSPFKDWLESSVSCLRAMRITRLPGSTPLRCCSESAGSFSEVTWSGQAAPCRENHWNAELVVTPSPHCLRVSLLDFLTNEISHFHLVGYQSRTVAQFHSSTHHRQMKPQLAKSLLQDFCGL